jgi:hypothetical protein
MIKASELRIGNWVNMAHENVPEMVNIKVLQFIVHANSRGDSHPFEPIPLTPKVLSACGFSFSEKKAHYTDGYHYYDFAFDDEKRLVYLSPNSNIRIAHYCDYLHQLQNLYFSLSFQELIYQP